MFAHMHAVLDLRKFLSFPKQLFYIWCWNQWFSTLFINRPLQYLWRGLSSLMPEASWNTFLRQKRWTKHHGFQPFSILWITVSATLTKPLEQVQKFPPAKSFAMEKCWQFLCIVMTMERSELWRNSVKSIQEMNSCSALTNSHALEGLCLQVNACQQDGKTFFLYFIHSWILWHYSQSTFLKNRSELWKEIALPWKNFIQKISKAPQ